MLKPTFLPKQTNPINENLMAKFNGKHLWQILITPGKPATLITIGQKLGN